MSKIRVLLVDDSALIRQLLLQILRSDPEIEVVGMASDPYAAWQKIKSSEVDVVTLDVEMPRMDGLTFLDKLMRAKPTPVVMISSLTEKGAETALRALELGAIDFVTKPKIDVQSGTIRLADEIIEKIKTAAQANLGQARRAAPARRPVAVSPGNQALIKSTYQVIAIGASTGGTEALYDVLTSLPGTTPGIVIVQHMPPGFTRSFAARLNQACKFEVKEAEDGDRIVPGRALLAPGDFHMEVYRSGADYRVRVFQAEPVNRFRPSVDVLFHSCAKHLGRNCVGVILTGMGYDGAKGMLAMHEVGARTIAQNEATCVVFGMPREAIAAGGVDEVLPLYAIPEKMLSMSEAAARC